jgi:hypothetical protein
VGVVLPERVALPVLTEEDAPKVRVTVEDHPEQVIALALVPVRAAVEDGERGAVGLAGTEPALHQDGERGVQVLDAAEHFQPVLLPVRRRQPVEVETAQIVLGEAPEVLPAVGGEIDGEEGALDGRLHAKPLPHACRGLARSQVFANLQGWNADRSSGIPPPAPAA